MKKFEAPEIEITLFSVQDILATSTGGSSGGMGDTNETPDLDMW